MTRGPTTIVLNGAWGRILSGIILAAILAGASGLVGAFRLSWAYDAQDAMAQDHEARLRVLEDGLGEVRAGIQVLLERTHPDPKR